VLSASGASKNLTLTGLYNVMQALREGRALSAKEQSIHQQGIIHWLRPDFQNPQSKLSNKDSNNEQPMQVQQALEVDRPQQGSSEQEGKTTVPTDPKTATPWPATLPEQISAVAQLLTGHPHGSHLGADRGGL